MTEEKLNIGIFSAMYSQMNGSAHAVRFLSEAIAELGHNVHVFAPKIVDGYKKPKTLHFHDLGGACVSPKTGFVLSFPFHKYFLCPHDLDVAHIQTHATIGMVALSWAKQLGIPTIGSHHSPMQFYTTQYIPILGRYLAKNDLLWRYERHVLEKYDLTHTPTLSKKDLLLNYTFKEPIVAMTNGIKDFYFQDVKVNGIREKYDIEDKKVMLYASRLSPEKHPIRIIKTFMKIHKKIPDAHLLLVGSEGPSTDAVKKIVKKRKYSDFVSYAGRVSYNDLLKLYNTADLTCLWSFVEAEGLVLIESMAQGTPSVGANASGISNVIRHGKTGYLANNLDQFEEYVVKLFKDDDLREKFSKNAKEVAENYRIKNIAKNWIELYKFARDKLYPLRYNRRPRNERVNMVKNYVRNLPNVYF
ncbi:MAG: glycosyltransferase [Candidatus Lokiarchaeota archaeon]|nr:glycosyltransferase [Candidatus Lokiarchaeota archaeon]MBD3199768.1 glycosyltransferase [Candidatus Lokiarchaeota archaeon]